MVAIGQISKISLSSFLRHFLITQTPYKLKFGFRVMNKTVNAKNNINQKNLNTLFANISKRISPTSDSFLDRVTNRHHYYYSIWPTIISVWIPMRKEKQRNINYCQLKLWFFIMCDIKFTIPGNWYNVMEHLPYYNCCHELKQCLYIAIQCLIMKEVCHLKKL